MIRTRRRCGGPGRRADMGSTCTGTGVSAGAFAEAIRSAAARKPPAEALAEVIDLAVRTGPGEAASIVMHTGNPVESVAYSDEVIRQAMPCSTNWVRALGRHQPVRAQPSRRWLL